MNELVVDKFHQRLSLAIKELEKKKKNGKIKIQEGKRNKNIWTKQESSIFLRVNTPKCHLMVYT